MSAGLNLTDDQRRRIEGAESPEERAAIIMEAVGEPRELGLEDMDAVSGGQEVIIPPTHEEIDEAWDMIQLLADVYGIGTASLVAADKQLIPYVMSFMTNKNYFQMFTIAEERAKMHNDLNARQGR